MTARFVAEFSCCVPRCHNMVMDILLCFYPETKKKKWTKHQQSVCDKMATVYTFSNACLMFQLEGLKKYDKEAAYHRAHK
jgi:hypothetical protein